MADEPVMHDTVGLSMFVCVAVLGLALLAVHASVWEHAVAAAVVAAVSLPLLVVRPEVGTMLLLAAALTGRLRGPAVPDTVPADWPDP